MGKESLKEHLDGKELDLSLSNLTKVPVKELAALTKATHLDLSCNQLASIPDNFGSLTHLVKIDLSKNSLASLPENIGNLENLQHLDLLGNDLEHLPISFCHLRKLRWLDLKDNEKLDKDLKKVAGDCLDDKQCKECAQRVVAYMAAIQRDLDIQHQKKLDKERKRQAAKERKQEAQRKEKQLQKQLQKQQERQKKTEKYEAAQAAKKHKEEQRARKSAKASTPKKMNGVEHHAPKPKSGSSCLPVLVALFVAVVALAIGVYFFCESDQSNALCADLHLGATTVVGTANDWAQQLRDRIVS